MIEDLTCKEVSRLISTGLDQEMAPPERARLRFHFLVCQTCRDVDEQLRFLSLAMRRLGREPDPPSEG